MSDNAFNIGTVIEDAKKVITNPIGFYREMPTEGGLTNPIIHVAVMAAITGVLVTILSIVGLGMGAMMGFGMALGAIIMFPIFAVIGSFIGAAIIFVIWKLMGSDKSYEVAYRCIAYAFSIAPVIAILSIIPYLAVLVRALWGCFLLYVASIEVHKLKEQTAKIVFGVLAAISLLFGISAENTARKWQSKAEKWEKAAEQMEKSYESGSIGKVIEQMENMDEMTPEEAGKQVGELLKGMEGFSKGLEESVKEESK